MRSMKAIKHKIFEQAGADGDAGGGGAPAAAAPASGNVMETAATGSGAPAPAAEAGNGSGDGTGQPVPLNELIPEKYRVMGADGKFDLDASSRKVEEARSHLEKRLGSWEAPPKEAKDYKLNVPDAYKDKINVEALAADPKFQDFVGNLHKANFTQAQFDIAFGETIDTALSVAERMSGRISPEQCMSKLKESGWDTDAKMKDGLAASVRGLSAAVGKDKAQSMIKRHGNDPDFIQAWAAIGRETREDTPGNGVGQAASGLDDQIASVRASEAYKDTKHPEHAKALASMTALYQKKHPARAAAR